MGIIEHIRGDTWRDPWTWRQENGFPLDLTDCTARWQLRDKPDGQIFVSATTEDGKIVIDDAKGGVVVITIPSEITETIKERIYVCDLELTFDTGERVSSEIVQFRVKKDITNG